MTSLRAKIRELQKLENEAAEKVGMRSLLLDDRKLFGKKSQEYIRKFINRMTMDVFVEAIKAAKLGRELNKTVTESGEKKK